MFSVINYTNLLIGSSSSGDKNYMETSKTKHRNTQNSNQNDQTQADHSWNLAHIVFVMNQVVSRKAEHGRHVQWERK